MQHKPRALFLISAVATTALLSGCSQSDEGASPPTSGATSASSAASAPASGEPTDDVTVVTPGRPGEEASTGAPEAPDPPGAPNHSDVAFMQMMVPHHAQAVEMARLADRYAVAPAVRSLAERIRAAQGPEIVMMSSWLEARNVDVPAAGDDMSSFDHGEHGHDAMQGMLTPAQLDELAAARGRAFDRLFLRRMIGHHEGALAMASTVAEKGEDVVVSELAADIDLTQSAEIRRMQQLLG